MCYHRNHLDTGALTSRADAQSYGSGRARTHPLLLFGVLCSKSYCEQQAGAEKFYHEPYWFDIMTEQDYVKLQNMEVEMRQTAVELLNMAFDDTLTHQLPPSLAWHLRGTALLIERGDGDASACVEALRSTELLLAELLRLSYDHAFPLESIWVKNTVIVAEKKLRDLLVVRAQLNVPFEKAAFEEAVAVAYGFRLVRGSQLYSQIMQSYRKAIWEKGFQNAFLSESEKEKQQSRRKRPKRDKK